MRTIESKIEDLVNYDIERLVEDEISLEELLMTGFKGYQNMDTNDIETKWDELFG